MNYLTTTFSPMMITKGGSFKGHEIDFEIAKNIHEKQPFLSAVGHEITAKILSAVLGYDIEYSRINISLKSGDYVLCIIPNFRSTEAREFTKEEVEAAGLRCFLIEVI